MIVDDVVVLVFEVLEAIFDDDIVLPLLPFPPRGVFEVLPSLLVALFELELPPVPLDDKTIFSGGTFSPLPADVPDVASVPKPDDFPDTLEELSLSSFSLSEWSRLWGFLGLFVAEVDPDDEDGLFLSFLSDDDKPLAPPLPFPDDALPK